MEDITTILAGEAMEEVAGGVEAGEVMGVVATEEVGIAVIMAVAIAEVAVTIDIRDEVDMVVAGMGADTGVEAEAALVIMEILTVRMIMTGHAMAGFKTDFLKEKQTTQVFNLI